MVEIRIDNGEREAETLNPETLERAARAIRKDGCVVLEDVVAHDHLDVLWDRMVEDLETILALDVVPHQFVFGNVQQDPPPFPPFVFRDVIENPWANQITRHLLGENVYNRFYSGNTNIPKSELQPIHVDGGDLWKGLMSPPPAHHLIVNIALREVTEANGSIELWPGSHLTMSNVLGEDIKVDPELVEARRKTNPPVRGNTRKGSLLIRDNRLWHRGMPNRSSDPRFMIALIHTAPFIERKRQLPFSRDLESLFDSSNPVTDYKLVDEPISYLTHHNPYDYPTEDLIASKRP